MDTSQLAEKSQFIYDNLRMKTFPVGVKFLKDKKGYYTMDDLLKLGAG